MLESFKQGLNLEKLAIEKGYQNELTWLIFLKKIMQWEQIITTPTTVGIKQSLVPTRSGVLSRKVPEKCQMSWDKTSTSMIEVNKLDNCMPGLEHVSCLAYLFRCCCMTDCWIYALQVWALLNLYIPIWLNLTHLSPLPRSEHSQYWEELCPFISLISKWRWKEHL